MRSKHRPKAILYARVSSKEQATGGFSIPAQQKLLRTYAGENGISIEEEFTDVETAKRAGRTSFERMVRHLKATPDCRIILVEKTDRLYRNFRDYVTLEDLDLEIHLVKENEVISKDSRSHQKFIHGIKLLMAKNYLDNLSEEVRKGMTEKAEQGEFPHRAPVGYRNDLRNHTVFPDEATADTVRRMFELYATGDCSLADIRRWLIESKVKMGSGSKPISKGQVEKILRNPFYVGRFRWKGNIYRGNHAPIITERLYDSVQALLNSRGPKSRKPRKHTFSFGGLMTCGECGCSIIAERKKGRYVYYHCTDYHRHCNQGYCREEALEAQFEAVVQGVTLDSETAEWVAQALRESLSDESRFHKSQVRALTAHLERVKNRIDQAYVDKLDGKITDEFWAERTREWQQEKERFARDLAGHLTADDSYIHTGVQILELSRRAYELYSKQDAGEKRRLLALLLSNCTLKDGQIESSYSQPFDILANMTAQAMKNAPSQLSESAVSPIWRGE